MQEHVRRALRHARWAWARRHTNNVDWNRDVWDWYAREWRTKDFRAQMAAASGAEQALNLLGDEWGAGDVIRPIFAGWIEPYLTPGAVVAEIGPGGGRWATRVAPRVAHYHGFDISKEMLKHLRQALAGRDNVTLGLLRAPSLPAELEGRVDFLFSFDVFVHIDLHTQWKYVQEVARVLKPGGHAFLHTANLTTDAGFEHFAGQDAYSPDTFYFMTPQAVRSLVSRAGLEVVRESDPEAESRAESKDYLVVVRKPSA